MCVKIEWMVWCISYFWCLALVGVPSKSDNQELYKVWMWHDYQFSSLHQSRMEGNVALDCRTHRLAHTPTNLSNLSPIPDLIFEQSIKMSKLLFKMIPHTWKFVFFCPQILFFSKTFSNFSGEIVIKIELLVGVNIWFWYFRISDKIKCQRPT